MDPLTMGALAPLVTGALGVFGQSQTNRANRDMAREQMRFQERMSSTAAQRAVADFRAAGLNPALAYGTTASSPSGSSSVMGDVAAAGINSAQRAREVTAAVKQAAASTQLTHRQDQKTAFEAREAELRALRLENTQDEWIKTTRAQLRQERDLLPVNARIRALDEVMLRYSTQGLTRSALSKLVPWLSSNVPEGMKPGRGPAMKFEEALPSRNPPIVDRVRVPNEFFNYKPR